MGRITQDKLVLGQSLTNRDEWKTSFETDGKSVGEFGIIKLKNVFNMLSTKLHLRMIVGRLTTKNENWHI